MGNWSCQFRWNSLFQNIKHILGMIKQLHIDHCLFVCFWENLNVELWAYNKTNITYTPILNITIYSTSVSWYQTRASPLFDITFLGWIHCVTLRSYTFTQSDLSICVEYIWYSISLICLYLHLFVLFALLFLLIALTLISPVKNSTKDK